MRVEILCTGNELLDGSVVDTNSAWLEAELFKKGIEVAEKRVVPDALEVITSAMREIASRADFCIVSGGLGPTLDDLSAEALAQAAGVSLAEHAPTVERLTAWMRARGRALSPGQLRQAQVPEGAEVFRNDLGSAPHLQMRIGKCQIALLPGVPRELRHLAERFVFPKIFACPKDLFFAFAVLRCYGIWEAEMAWAVRELPENHPGLRVGTRTTSPENHLKLRTQGITQAEADAKLENAVRDAREKLGDRVYAVGDSTFAEVTFAKLQAEGATVAFAESVSGGLASSLLCEVPGASDVLNASFVVYQDRAKRELLGVRAELLQRDGAVSESVTRELAIAARARAGTTYGVGITGFAGPGGGTERDPVGTYFAAIDGPGGTQAIRRVMQGADRERVRRAAAYAGLDLLRRAGRSAAP